MKQKLAFLLLFVVSLIFSQQTKIIGKITDESNKGIIGDILVEGTVFFTSTDANGNYELIVDNGNYSVTFNSIGYKELRKDIELNGTPLTLDVQLKSDQLETQQVKKLDEVRIVAKSNKANESALLLQQKKAEVIVQSIGAQELSRKGVSDVEEGLTKITGITKVDGRGLFVRGLEDRYNNLLINGFAVPSNSPFKKIIPLDLFPTDVVMNMDVYKTFNSDLYGDMGGATININTSQGTGNKTKLNFGFGFATGNNFKDFLIDSDANNTNYYFGLGGKNRELPSDYGKIPAGLSSKNFKSGFNVEQISAPINTNFGILHSGKLDFLKNKLNYLISLNHDNSYLIREGVDRFFSQGQGIYDNNLVTTQYINRTNSSVLLALNYLSSRLKINHQTLFLRSTENLIQDQFGYTRNNTQQTNQLIRGNQYTQSDYLNTQLFGSYKITSDDKHSINGGISFSKTDYKQPDRKFIDALLIENHKINASYGGNNLLRQFLDANGEFFTSARLEYNWKFGEDTNRQHKFSAGYNGYANSFITTYRFVFGKPLFPQNQDFNLNSIDETINQDVNNGLVRFLEESTGDYKNKLYQNIQALYVSLLYKFSDKFDANLGLRGESTSRELKFRTLGNSFTDKFRKNELTQTDILPSLNLKYAIDEQSNLRLATSKTLTRPVLMELLPITYINPDGTSERGNIDIKNSENYNFDLKYEWFPSKNELVAITPFYKRINNPIERTIEQIASGSGQQITYFNNKTATLLGVELEFLVQLNRISEVLNNFSLGFNTSWMFTEVQIDKNRTGFFDTFDKSRELQGASRNLINADLKYEWNKNENFKNTFTLVYSVFSKRIFAVGIAGFDHIYEMPFHKLDFVWSSNINKKWDFKFAVDNIINPTYKKELGNDSKIEINEPTLILRDFKRGVGFSLSVGYSF